MDRGDFPITCRRNGRPTNLKVHDGAALSAGVELSARSTGRRASTVDLPAVTGGCWKTTLPFDTVRV